MPTLKPGRSPFPWWRVLLLALLLMQCPGVEPADSSGPSEYEVKAAFLFNFTRYVEWPPGAFEQGDSPMTIGVLGDDPFGRQLDELVKGEQVNDRKLVVKRSAKPDELKGCQVVFISRSEKGRLAQDLAALGPGPMLTVSDIDAFADSGGIIRLYLSGRKVRFEINQTAARDHHLKLSAQLLSLGRIIDPVDGAAAP